MTEPQYDPETCVHASELRERGFPIPEHIPDCAWIPRNAIAIADWDVQQDLEEKTKFNFDFAVVFAQPFRWIEGRFTVNEKL